MTAFPLQDPEVLVVVLILAVASEVGHLAAAVEMLSADRLAALRAAGPAVLAITARRAETLKARAYDGDLARVRVPLLWQAAHWQAPCWRPRLAMLGRWQLEG